MSKRRIHENSLEAYNQVLRTVNARERVVLGAYLRCGKMTDRKCRDFLRFDDMNDVRPRISELVKKHLLIELEEKDFDQTTRKRVRVCRAASVEEYMRLTAVDSRRQTEWAFI